MLRTLGAGTFLALATLLPVQQAAAQDPVGGAIVGGALGGIVGGALGRGPGAAIAGAAITANAVARELAMAAAMALFDLMTTLGRRFQRVPISVLAVN